MTISGDTDDLVATTLWGEAVVIRRNTPSYSFGIASDSWATVATVNADIQPFSGNNPTVNLGQERVSTHRAFFADGTDILQGDRLRDASWTTGADEYEVDAVLDEEGHTEVYLSKVAGHA